MFTKNNTLKIFEEFLVDFNLPKHNKTSLINDVDREDSGTSLPISSFGSNDIIESDGETPEKLQKKQYNGLFNNITSYFKNYFIKKKNNDRTETISVKKFFENVKNSLKCLNDDTNQGINNVLEYYETSINNAKKLGQEALYDKLLDKRGVVINELKLLDGDFSIYITEKELFFLYKENNYMKDIKLTWIKNFARIIPLDILEKKENADKLMVFDNYVVLHYDPQNNSTEDTKEEIERKKDPILFGVISGSNKLYFIGDWIDEICDLTLDVLFETLGREPNKLNEEKIKKFINYN